MLAGIVLNNNINIEIGDSIDNILSVLSARNVKYNIPLNREDTDGNEETIVNIKELDIDITATNRRVNYIRSGNNNITHIMKLEYIADGTKVNIDDLKKIKEIVYEKYNGYRLIIEQIDTDKTILRFVVSDNKNKVRVSINRDRYGNIYFNTFNLIS